MTTIPESLHILFWDVDPAAIRLPEHDDYVIERIMTRGTWEAMQWLRSAYDRTKLAEFLTRKAERIPPRERAYWELVTGVIAPQVRGGGRPSWAGT
jgi:hypothetical protein